VKFECFGLNRGTVRAVLVAATLLLPVSGWSAVILGNLPQTNDNNQTALPSTAFIKAFSFTMPLGDPFKLDSVVLRLTGYTTPPDMPEVQIRNHTGGVNPGSTVLASFTNPASQGSGTFNYTFTPTAPFVFHSSTSYWLWVAVSAGGFDFESSSPAITPTGIATYNTFRFSNDSGATFSTGAGTNINSFSINGSPVPEPSAIVLSGIGLAALAFAKRKK
jgi:hypothetical protein